ncbi:MAG TPA: tRNA (adenosine(37)-N6)-threonylcarbamoyltransferase complex dimerization subunit type 1 TsaB [Gemmatimonadaceae bacterium]|nr:tRNA (adenosine(37)-N6)-threonylcarbamoyltransferase complex dimerization subunit type 1 TsaB [Gemmatimonadaceae bacterium]
MEGVTLALDGSTYRGSAAAIRDGTVLAEETIAMRGEREERLMPAAALVLESAGSRIEDVARVICGSGPGSFTSLRIAAGIAKGIANGRGVPLFAVSSLALAAVEAGTGKWLVALDALRGEAFVAGYAWDGAVLATLSVPGIAASDALESRAAELGASVTSAAPHARAAAPLLQMILAAGPVVLASWEPTYGRKAEAEVQWEAAHGRSVGGEPAGP